MLLIFSFWIYFWKDHYQVYESFLRTHFYVSFHMNGLTSVNYVLYHCGHKHVLPIFFLPLFLPIFLFVMDILQEQKYMYGREWNKTPWWRNLIFQNNNLSCVAEVKLISSCFPQRLLCSWGFFPIGHWCNFPNNLWKKSLGKQ